MHVTWTSNEMLLGRGCNSYMVYGLNVWRCQKIDGKGILTFNSVFFGSMRKQQMLKIKSWYKFVSSNWISKKITMERACAILYLLSYILIQNNCNGQFHSEKMYWLDSLKSKDLLEQFIPSMTQPGSSDVGLEVSEYIYLIIELFLRI